MSETEKKPPKLEQLVMPRVLGWAVSAMVGVLFTLAVDASRGSAVTESLQQRLSKVETHIEYVEKDLASGGPAMLARRVDELQASTKDIKLQLDVIQEAVTTLVARSRPTK